MKLVKILCFVIVILVIGNVTLTNRAVDESAVVSSLSADISGLEKANTILKAEVATAGSLTSLNDKILAAGFVDSKQIASLPILSNVAMAK